MMKKRNAWIAGGVALMLAVAGCSGGSGGSGGGGSDGALAGAKLTAGSKEFTEQIILSNIAALAFEHAGAQVADQTGISGTATVRSALETGEIDFYWEYTGTAWVQLLGHTTQDVPDDLFDVVRSEDAVNGIAWLDAAPFENAYRIATTKDFAQANNLVTSSDMAAFSNANPDKGRICAASEFINRDDGLPGLEKAYGFTYSQVVELDLNLIYSQVGSGCEFGEVFSTDARILSNNLLVLDDDQAFFVPYQGAFTLRQETLDQYPAIAEIMDPISKVLTSEVVTELNGRVDNDGEEPRDVAKDWLTQNGFI
ncbi:glycine betaine ABC transporter substrate-binding protein [Brooklawnia sp.]|uniref:glycine betaine ABC transporter substrate-binding protein n=1 Tax=Brooklawnia sp. TaxID=2699740 RepID=UPI00311D4AF6